MTATSRSASAARKASSRTEGSIIGWGRPCVYSSAPRSMMRSRPAAAGSSKCGTPGMAAFDATLRPPAARITCASAHSVPPANSPSIRCAALRRRGRRAAAALASKLTADTVAVRQGPFGGFLQRRRKARIRRQIRRGRADEAHRIGLRALADPRQHGLGDIRVRRLGDQHDTIGLRDRHQARRSPSAS